MGRRQIQVDVDLGIRKFSEGNLSANQMTVVTGEWQSGNSFEPCPENPPSCHLSTSGQYTPETHEFAVTYNEESMGANPSYPISLLIADLIAEHQGDESAFVKDVLGYDDLERGTSKLRKWLVNGEGPNSVIRGIAWATGRGSELQDAIVETERIKREEAEAKYRRQCEAEADTFQPFLTAIGEYRVPSPIFAFGATGGHASWTIIRVPQRALGLPVEQQIPALWPFMQRYRRKYNGMVPFWGPLKEFRLVRLVDYLSFTPEGEFIGLVDRPFRLGSTTLVL
jgi:hypothetical protein